jgi:hypothetical protein
MLRKVPEDDTLRALTLATLKIRLFQNIRGQTEAHFQAHVPG